MNLSYLQFMTGFIQCSNGSRIQIKDSTLTCKLDNNVNGFGVLVLQKWN